MPVSGRWPKKDRAARRPIRRQPVPPRATRLRRRRAPRRPQDRDRSRIRGRRLWRAPRRPPIAGRRAIVRTGRSRRCRCSRRDRVEGGRIAATQRFGPAAPVARSLQGDRLEDREAAQRLAARRNETPHIRRTADRAAAPGARARRRSQRAFSKLSFSRQTDWYSTDGALAALATASAEAASAAASAASLGRSAPSSASIWIGIEKAPVGGMIRARAFAIASEQNMQRIDAERRRAGASRRLAEQAERREIADALGRSRPATPSRRCA